MVRARTLVVMAFGAALVGCGDTRRCSWADPITEVAVPTAPTLALVCGGESESVAQRLTGSYFTSTPPDSRPEDAFLVVDIDTEAPMMGAELTFSGKLADGSYEVGDGGITSAYRSLTISGTFAFRRTRDVPFIDLQDPDERRFESSIDVDFDLTITNPERDCTLTTGPQQAHLVAEGPVECKPDAHSNNSHPG